MSILQSVAISGTVGKQLFNSNKPSILRGVILDPGTVSGSSITIRDGNASGEVKLTCRAVVGESISVPINGIIRFDKGMHVKVLGNNAVAYLELD